MSSTELALRNEELDELGRVAKALALSGYFQTDQRLDIAIAQMATKILAGRELGFGPFASANGISIIKGRPVVGANLIAAAIKRHPRYNYKLRQHTAEVCQIEFFEDGVSSGIVTFTIEEARAANLVGKDNWKGYPSDMLFARCISRGMRRFAPDCFGGSVVYAPEDFGVNVDAGETIESSTEDDDGMWEVQAEPEPEIEFMAVKLPEPDAPPAPRNIVLASEASLKKLHTVGSIYYKDKWDDKRHDLAEHVSKGATRSSKELSVREVNILIDGIEEKIHTVEPEQEAMPL